MRKLILTLFLLLTPLTASASILGIQQGGTASSTLTGILMGNGIGSVRTLTIGTNLTLSGTTLNATGGSGGTGAATSSFAATYPILVTSSASAITFSTALSTTTINVCASGCPFSSIQSALTAGFKTLNLAPETYTLASPVTLSQNKITIIGAGPNTILACNTSSIPTCLLGTTALSSENIRDLTINNTGPSGTGTCIDFTQMGASEFSSVDCTGNFQVGYIASTTADTSYNVIRQPVINVAGAGGYGIYFGAHAINNTIEYPRINPNGDDRVTGLYLDGQNTFCIHCETEKYAGIGLEVGSDARSMDLNVYMELDKTNIQIDKDAYAINITGFSGDASSSAQNLSDLGARGLQVAANIGYRPTYYLNNINWGIGTSTPGGMLSIQDWPASSSTLPFIISSSTLTGTTTLFSVDNVGNASTTNLTDSGLTSGNCVQAGAGGLLTTTGTGCGSASGLSSYDAWTHLSYAGQTTSATTATMWFTNAVKSLAASSSDLTYASTTAITSVTASTTVLNISGATTFQSLLTGANRFLIIGATGIASTIGLPLSVANGGTGATALGSSMLVGTNVSGGTLVSTSSPTADHYSATSTLVASTFPYASTTAISSSNLVSGNCVQAGTGGLLTTTGSACGSGGAASAFEVATTSNIAISQIAYINQTTGRTTLASAATTTLTGTAPITFSQPIAVIGSSASIITCAVATASVPGCLAAADFTTFASKMSDTLTFTHTSYGGQVTSATTSTLWLTNATISLAASSSVLTYASSTYSSFLGASSTKYFGAGLDAGCNGTSFLQITSGTFGCSTPAGGSGAGDSFTHPTIYSTTTSATSTSLATAGVFFSSSTQATSTFAGALQVSSGIASPYLLVGSTSPPYGYDNHDLLSVVGARNDYQDLHVTNSSSGACATADLVVQNNMATAADFFGDIGHTSSGFTGSGCANNPFTGFGASSMYMFDPDGNMNFGVASTSGVVARTLSFNWFWGGYTSINKVMSLASTSLQVNDRFGTNVLTVSTASTTWPYDLIEGFTATSTGPIFAVDSAGHLMASSTYPTLSSCGTSPSLSNDSSDFSGTITVGSVAATACTLTFGNAHINSPHCVISEQTGSVVNASSYTESVTGFTYSQTGLTSDKLDYICTGK